MRSSPREAPREPSRDLRTHRLESFSDGVFAIAITLLVLEIAVPAGSEDHLLQAVREQWPSYLAYVVSFSTVGLVWLSHTTITEYMVRVDRTFLRLNLILLLVVGFLPFPTKLVAEYIGDDDAERVAVTIYGLSLLACSVMVSLLWRYAVVHELVDPDTDDDEALALGSRLERSILSYVPWLIVGLFRPGIAVVGFLVIALLFIFPLPRLMRMLRRGRPKRRARRSGD